LVVAEDALARAGLAALIAELPSCTPAGQTSGSELLSEESELFRPDIVVWDMGLDAAKPIRRLPGLSDSGFPIIALVPNEDVGSAVAAYGVRGILSRNVTSRSLLAAIRAIAEGLTVVDAGLANAMLSVKAAPTEPLAEPLTPRELEVLQLLAQGIPNKAIASQLSISEHTVKFHVNSILSKLEAQSRTEAVTRGTRLGLVKL
jgi:DNA-binding NarL/FixJ family response regulator